jgi:epoxyqueuosine reductase
MDSKLISDELKNLVVDYVRAYPQKNCEPEIWREPLLVTARADSRFHILPTIAARDHLLPQELLSSARSVVVFFIPFVKALALDNHKGDTPCRNWGLAYESTNSLINSLCDHIKNHLDDLGFAAELMPATHNFDSKRLVSQWSHKHLGHIAGLGRFGVNAQFITPAGCAGRLGSLVTDADLGDTPLVGKDELCLHKNGQTCLVCVRRCPVGAVSEEGINRRLCWERLKANLEHSEALKGLEGSTHVCGKCQVLVPCSLKIPRGKSLDG